MTVNFDDSSRNPNRKVPRNLLKGSAYTALSRVPKRNAIRVQNFNKDLIMHNEEALVEMQRLRKDSPFIFRHPLQQLQGEKICLNNIKLWFRYESDKALAFSYLEEKNVHLTPVSDVEKSDRFPAIILCSFFAIY